MKRYFLTYFASSLFNDAVLCLPVDIYRAALLVSFYSYITERSLTAWD
jgi:hypothetical protein